MYKQSRTNQILNASQQQTSIFNVPVTMKKKQLFRKTINVDHIESSKQQKNFQVIRIIPRSSLQPFRWASKKVNNSLLQQKNRYQSLQPNKNQIKQPNQNQQKRQEISPPNKLNNIINDLQPLMTIRQLRERKYLRKRSNVNQTQRQIRVSPGPQFTSRKRFIRPENLYTNFREQRVYIFNSKDQYIRKNLMGMGWKQSRNKNGYTYQLKWTTTDNPIDYMNLRDGQYINHIRNSDQLTNKIKLTNNLMKSQNIDFFPTTYDLNIQFYQFTEKYNDVGMLSLLKKYIQHMRKKCYALFQKPIKTHLGLLLKSNNFLASQNDENFTLNVPLLVSLSFYLERMRRKLNINYFDEEIFIQADLNLDNRIIQTILAYNKVPIQQKAQIKKQIQDKILENHILQGRYQTPSNQLISLLIHYYTMFKNNINGFQSDGINNLWLLKSVSTAKAQSIQLINKIQGNSSKFRNKIAQKYIENCLIFRGAKKQNFFWKYVEGKKFDIRQWVLVTTQPTRIYKFSSCYLRFTSEFYVFDKLKDQKKNLSNYFANKTYFQTSEQWTILSIQQLFNYLLLVKQIDFEQTFNQQMNNIILQTINTCIDKLDLKKNCFELLGFDIIIDQNYKLWLMEVNSSPSCDQKTSWLKQMVNCMGYELLKIVLPQQYFSNLRDVRQKKYEWIQLYDNGKVVYNQTRTNIRIQTAKQQSQKQKMDKHLINQIKKRQKSKRLFYQIAENYLPYAKFKIIQDIKQLKPQKYSHIYQYNTINLFIKSLELILRRRKKPILKLFKSEFSNLYTQISQIELTTQSKNPTQIISTNTQDLNRAQLVSYYQKFFGN